MSLNKITWMWAGWSVGISVCKPAELKSNASCGGQVPSLLGWKNGFELISSILKIKKKLNFHKQMGDFVLNYGCKLIQQKLGINFNEINVKRVGLC